MSAPFWLCKDNTEFVLLCGGGSVCVVDVLPPSSFASPCRMRWSPHGYVETDSKGQACGFHPWSPLEKAQQQACKGKRGAKQAPTKKTADATRKKTPAKRGAKQTPTKKTADAPLKKKAKRGGQATACKFPEPPASVTKERAKAPSPLDSTATRRNYVTCLQDLGQHGQGDILVRAYPPGNLPSAEAWISSSARVEQYIQECARKRELKAKSASSISKRFVHCPICGIVESRKYIQECARKRKLKAKSSSSISKPFVRCPICVQGCPKKLGHSGAHRTVQNKLHKKPRKAGSSSSTSTGISKPFVPCPICVKGSGKKYGHSGAHRTVKNKSLKD